MKVEVETEPAPFSKRVTHPPYARGGYNSEEWVFDDEDDDDGPIEQSDGGEEDPRHRHHPTGITDDGIRSLEVSPMNTMRKYRQNYLCPQSCALWQL